MCGGGAASPINKSEDRMVTGKGREGEKGRKKGKGRNGRKKGKE